MPRRFRTATVAGATSVVLSILLTSACSSVPDVQFGDGGSSATSNGGSSGAQPEPPPDWACPGKPPPAGRGVCCGNRICLKCTESDCKKCEEEGCEGTLSTVCCRRNVNFMDCKAYDGC